MRAIQKKSIPHYDTQLPFPFPRWAILLPVAFCCFGCIGASGTIGSRKMLSRTETITASPEATDSSTNLYGGLTLNGPHLPTAESAGVWYAGVSWSMFWSESGKFHVLLPNVSYLSADALSWTGYETAGRAYGGNFGMGFEFGTPRPGAHFALCGGVYDWYQSGVCGRASTGNGGWLGGDFQFGLSPLLLPTEITSWTSGLFYMG